MRQLHDDLRSWRIRVENLFHRWSENPTDTPENDLQERFAQKLVTMEERIKETVDPASPRSLNEEDLDGNTTGFDALVIATFAVDLPIPDEFPVGEPLCPDAND